MSGTKKSYRDRLKEGVVLFDGAMGTMLYDKGVFINQCFEHVCVTRPDLVKEIHMAYAAAGSHVIESNSYGANRIKLSGYGLADNVKEINQAAVKLAREAAGEDLYVAGSVGPIGTRLEPVGKVPVSEAAEAFKEQISAILEAGVDLLLFETFIDIEELLLAVSIARELDKEIPIQAQITFGRLEQDEYEKEVVAAAKKLQLCDDVDVIGINCTVGPAHMLDLLTNFKKLVTKPVAIQPNAGYPRDVDGRQLYLASPDYFAEYAMRFLDAGAAVIGGCCGTTPEHILKMGKAVLSMDSGRRHIEVAQVAEGVQEKEAVPLAKRSRLGNKLAKGEWISTVELVSPAGTDLSKMLAKCDDLYRNGVDFINIPDGPRASSRMSALVTTLEIERYTKAETILHVCTRDINLIGLQALLLGAQAAGLRDMLLITGDPPKVGRYPDVTGVFDVDSIGLLALAKRLNSGIDLGGNEIPTPTSFVCGAGVNPASATLETEIERAYKKAEAGAEFFITQPVYDIEQLSDFLKKIEGTGVPVIAGVWPLASYRNALFLHNEVPGVTIPEVILERMKKPEDKEAAREEGIQVSREIIAEVKSQIAGIQVSPPFGRIQTALDVIKGWS